MVTGENVQDCSNKLIHKSVLRDCISMCFDICAINIHVSIRVRGLHLVFQLRHRRPQTVGGFKKCFEEKAQTHGKALRTADRHCLEKNAK